MGEDEWNKLSDAEKQRRIVELKMKERKLRQEGNVEEAAAIFEKVLENDECRILAPDLHFFYCNTFFKIQLGFYELNIINLIKYLTRYIVYINPNNIFSF